MRSIIKKIAIFASGEGSNFTALCQAIKREKMSVQVVLLVCDHQNVPVLQRAKNEGVPTLVVNFRNYPDKASAEAVITARLAAEQIDFILLAGYMRIIGPTLLAGYAGKMVNIHPALLPSFPGRQGIEDAYEAGVSITGVTIHWVDAGVDSGQIIAQRQVPIYKTDQLTDLEQRIHQVEHKFYPSVVKELLEKGEF